MIVNSQGDVKWIHGALGGREGQREEAVRDKYRGSIGRMEWCVIGINGNVRNSYEL